MPLACADLAPSGPGRFSAFPVRGNLGRPWWVQAAVAVPAPRHLRRKALEPRLSGHVSGLTVTRCGPSLLGPRPSALPHLCPGAGPSSPSSLLWEGGLQANLRDLPPGPLALRAWK